MTVGSKTNDYTYSIPDDGTGTGSPVNGLGRKVQKTWSGADRPRVAFPKAPRLPKPSKFVYMYRGKDLVKVKVTSKYTFRPSKVPRRAANVDHPYQMTYSDRTVGLVQVNLTGLDDPKWAFRPSPDTSFVPTQSFDSNDMIALMGRLRDRVAGSSFNAGVSLGESREAIHMIGDTAKRIALALNAVKHGKLDKAARFLVNGTDREKLFRANKRQKTFGLNRTDPLADHWLALQYGWLPLLNDVKSAAEFAAHHLSVPLKQTVRASLRKFAGEPARSVSPFTWVFGTTRCMASGVVRATITERDVASLAGLMDPLSVAWELLPYSFVVDWFIPVGNWLSARGLASSLSGNFTVSIRISDTVAGVSPAPGFPSGYLIGGSCLYKSGSLTRTVSTDLPIPLPSWKPLGQAASWRHAANGVALLQRFVR